MATTTTPAPQTAEPAGATAEDPDTKQAPAPSPAPVTVVMQATDRNAEAAKAMADGAALGMDRGAAGGRYLVDGRLVDANGAQVKAR